MGEHLPTCSPGTTECRCRNARWPEREAAVSAGADQMGIEAEARRGESDRKRRVKIVPVASQPIVSDEKLPEDAPEHEHNVHDCEGCFDMVSEVMRGVLGGGPSDIDE